ncbi:hypothetical protein Tco_0689022, partial [Tanacetum coccineum]
ELSDPDPDPDTRSSIPDTTLKGWAKSDVISSMNPSPPQGANAR